MLLLVFAAWRLHFDVGTRALAWYACLGLGAAALLSAARLGSAGVVVGASAVLLTGIPLVYAVEIGLGLSKPLHKLRMQRRVAAATGVPFDARSVPEFVRARRDSGETIMPSVVPIVVLDQAGPPPDPVTGWHAGFLPLAGVANVATVQLCNEDGQFRTYRSDAHGFENPAGAPIDGPLDLALIGDSFTHGYCVAPDSSYAGRMRRWRPATLNLGTGGSGPLVELATLTEYAAPLRPRVVIWQYFANDLGDLEKERRHARLLAYLDQGHSQSLRQRQPEIDAAIVPWVEQLYRAGRGVTAAGEFSWKQVPTLYRLRQLLASVARPDRPDDTTGEQLALVRRILREARDRVRGWGGTMYFVFVPEWERFFQPEVVARHDVRDSILAIARELDLPVIDLLPAVRAHPDVRQLYARREFALAHLSNRGYDLMARIIKARLEADGAFPTPSMPPAPSH